MCMDKKPVKKKPPLPIGVMPRILWIEQRITELVRAIHEFTVQARYSSLSKWTEELDTLIKEWESIKDKDGD